MNLMKCLTRQLNTCIAAAVPQSNQTWCLRKCLRSSSFVAPERPTIDITDTKSAVVEGREDPKLFSDEYIPPLVQPDWHRNKLKYRLERMDCLRRRNVMDIPEFYAGSILAVTYADQYAPGKTMRFVGRCLYRDGFGLKCSFLLRNILDGEGVELIFQLYSPLIQKFEVLRLEKWLDTDLRYLRDADPAVCTIDPNMLPEAPLPNTEELPVFKGKVEMKHPSLWQYRYTRTWPPPYNAFIEAFFVEEHFINFEKLLKPRKMSLKYDICRHYDVTKMKPEIMEEMKTNKERIAVADQTEVS